MSRKSLLRLAGLFLSSTISLYAQYETATVLGYVRDASGAAVRNGTVTLLEQDTGARKQMVTNDQGAYEFPDVKVGQYRVSVEANGFSPTTTESFTVTVNAHQRVDVPLPVGPVLQSVQVSGAASALETDSSNRGQLIDHEAIVELPLNGRNYADLALLAPGVHESTKGTDGREASFNVNGLRSAYNNFLLDGLDNNAYATSNQGYSNQNIDPAPDALREFRIDTSTYSAEYGRAAGSVVNASVLSGTDAFHGAAWEFLRNTSLNAVGYFAPSGGKPTLVQNQFGGAVGGPIRRDKMFFFADYEGFRSVAHQLSTLQLPSLLQRSGQFGVPIQNPYTGEIYQDGVIPQSVLAQHPFGSRVLSDLPAPNTSDPANNFAIYPYTSSPSNKGDGRFDHILNDHLSYFGRYSLRVAYIDAAPNPPGLSGAGVDVTRVFNRQIALGATWTMNAKSILDVRLGLDRTEGSDNPQEELDNSPSMLERYGITGLPTTKPLAGGLNDQSISGYAGMGRDSGQHQNPVVINPKANYSRIVGPHTIKTGFEFQSIATEVVDFNPMYGKDTYSGQFSRPAGATNDSLYNIADFLLGARSKYQLTNPGVARYRQQMYFPYLQDDWRVNRKLTLNLGLRYEFATPQYESNNHLSNFDPVTQSMITAHSGDLYDRALVNPDPWNFAPRLGFAYSAHPGTVVRSAFGMGYIHFNRYGGENLLAYNGPFIVGAQVTQQPSLGLCTSDLNPSSCFRPTDQGYPSNFAVPAAFNTANTLVRYSPANTKSTYVQTWHMTVEQELGHDFVLDLAYVGNRGRNILMLGDYNQAVPNQEGQNLPLSARQPIAGFTTIQANFDGGFSNYNGLQVRVEKTYSRGLYLLNSFTWSKTIDNGSGNMEVGAGDDYPVNYRDLNYTRGLSGQNQPLNNTTTIVWDLPFGRNRAFGAQMPAWANTIAGGWQTAFINTMNSGVPVNIKYDPSSDQTVSSLPTYRPNLVGQVLVPAGQRNVNHYFDINALAVPSVSQPFGNIGRNTERAPAYYNLDFALHKNFALPLEATSLEFRAEAFNLLNKSNFMAPASDISSGDFGTITSTYPAREVQFGLKLLF